MELNGEGGIRTHGSFHFAGFQDRWNRAENQLCDWVFVSGAKGVDHLWTVLPFHLSFLEGLRPDHPQVLGGG